MKTAIQRISISIMLILLGVFLWQNHSNQKQIDQFSSLYSLLNKVQQHYHIYYQQYGKFPRNNKQAKLPAPEDFNNDIVSAMVVLSDQRVFITLALDQPATIYLTPEVNSDNRFLWHCRTPNLPENLKETLFDGCRSTTENLTKKRAVALQYKPRPKKQETLDITLPPRTPIAKEAPKPCEEYDQHAQLLLHDNGIGLWELDNHPRLKRFIPFEINRPNGIAALIGNTVFAVKNGYIWFLDASKADSEFEKSSVWVKPGTELYSAGRRLIWITKERNMLIGDICHPPNIRIIHTSKLDISSNEKIKTLEFKDNILRMLSRYESDWSNSSELNQFRIKENGTLVHLFRHRFRGNANSMYLHEPYLLIANGREGLAIHSRTSDHRWMESQTVSALDYAMDGIIQNNTLWLADRSAGVLTFIRTNETSPWEQLDQQQFDFPIFKLLLFPNGLLASSATQHAWIPKKNPDKSVILNQNINQP